VARLSEEFRANAEAALRLTGSEGAAYVWEEAAKLVDQCIEDSSLEPLTLDLAAAESGYTRGHLLRMLRDGKFPNSGTEKDPRILRMHLPRKPGYGVDAPTVQPPSSQAQAARAVIEGED
jgi:hypothetical protein